MPVVITGTKDICHALGCPEVIAEPKVFCSSHWDKLPVELRERLSDAYGVDNKAWHAALKQCINFLSRK